MITRLCFLYGSGLFCLTLMICNMVHAVNLHMSAYLSQTNLTGVLRVLSDRRISCCSCGSCVSSSFSDLLNFCYFFVFSSGVSMLLHLHMHALLVWLCTHGYLLAEITLVKVNISPDIELLVCLIKKTICL